jgi:hypothetical protein
VVDQRVDDAGPVINVAAVFGSAHPRRAPAVRPPGRAGWAVAERIIR